MKHPLTKILAAIPDAQVEHAICDIMMWLHSKECAVCIFTAEEVSQSVLRVKDVEESMCSSGWDTIRCFPAEGFVDKEDEE